MNLSAREALEQLKAGNLRFVARTRGEAEAAPVQPPSELVSGQQPFAIILGCSDSRVPVEIVFDQGLGELFVIRVAGNIVAPSQVGSVEFAAALFGARLVVVLGHSGCGAVTATLEEIQREQGHQSRNLRAIVDRIRPAVETVLAAGSGLDQETLIRHSVRANVRAAANHLRHGSSILEALIRDEGLRIIGAEYCLETGTVEFLDDLD